MRLAFVILRNVTELALFVAGAVTMILAIRMFA
jgi:hypothetical protein